MSGYVIFYDEVEKQKKEKEKDVWWLNFCLWKANFLGLSLFGGEVCFSGKHAEKLFFLA